MDSLPYGNSKQIQGDTWSFWLADFETGFTIWLCLVILPAVLMWSSLKLWLLNFVPTLLFNSKSTTRQSNTIRWFSCTIPHPVSFAGSSAAVIGVSFTVIFVRLIHSSVIWETSVCTTIQNPLHFAKIARHTHTQSKKTKWHLAQRPLSSQRVLRCSSIFLWPVESFFVLQFSCFKFILHVSRANTWIEG